MYTHLVDVGSCLDELTDYNILSIVAGQMEWGVTISVHLIYLCDNRKNPTMIMYNSKEVSRLRSFILNCILMIRFTAHE